MRLHSALWLSLAAAAVLSGCNSAADNSDVSTRKVRVVATTGMIADLAKNMGGERTDVTGLMGAGVDPHLYRPEPRDVDLLGKADLILYNGQHLEGKMSDVLDHLKGRKIATVAVTDRFDPKKDLIHAEEGFEAIYDPHVWFDVSLWMKAAERVRDALVERDPKHAEVYRTNAAKYVVALAELHAYVKSQATGIPKEKRVLITAHDAFHYFGRAYDFEVRGLQGVSTATEASPKAVSELATLIADRKIPAIFVESSVPQKNVEAVQAAVRAKGFDVALGGELYSDALGTPGTPTGTYVGMVRHNIDTLFKALAK
jgi:manganese/zinc/iron transport system substrate-binding protein